jgi:DNA-binding NarL/FixJ family response regulator
LRGNGYAAKLDAASVMLEAQLAALSEAAGEPLLECEKPLLLLAHRDALLLRALRRALGRRYRVLVATSASESLRLLAEHAVDVMVADEELEQAPGGVWLLERARASFPEVGRILVSEHVVTDGAGAGETIEHWVRSGARLELLFDRIARALERA